LWSLNVIFAEDQLEKEDPDDDHFKNFLKEELKMPEAIEAKKRGLDSQSMGLRYPIWVCACDHKNYKYILTAHGNRKWETAFLRIANLSDPNSFDFERHPQLQKLACHLVKFLQQRYNEQLRIPVSHHSTILQQSQYHPCQLLWS
jgi:hypothetical protein